MSYYNHHHNIIYIYCLYISIITLYLVVRSYLACDHRVPKRYRARFVQHVYVGLHVVTVDGFGRT